jgi:predicted Zn finger-like uncharacterized protein|tara:strand:+ start:205 stop:702 length:498 start_codon:yes stop_codon:yes gene_type:complete
MIIVCKSCQKNFVVPDNAITANGRLVQCSSCGNKWTQYPIKKEIKIEQEIKIKDSKPSKKVYKKSLVKKKVDTYSIEYLQKKHGIKVINPSSAKIKKINTKKNKTQNFGFYNYLIIFVVSITTFFAILNLTKEILIFNYPGSESYIIYLYETLNNIRLIITDFIL